jgi:hypothetical protein
MTFSIYHRIKSLSLYLVLFVLLAGSGCTKDFKETNTNNSAIGSVDASSLPFMFSYAENQGVYSSYDYQIAENLFADIYAQYFALTATYFNSDRYNLRMDWLIAHWRDIYSAALPALQTVLGNTDSLSPEHAVCEVWRVYMFHRLTDY